MNPVEQKPEVKPVTSTKQNGGQPMNQIHSSQSLGVPGQVAHQAPSQPYQAASYHQSDPDPSHVAANIDDSFTSNDDAGALLMLNHDAIDRPSKFGLDEFPIPGSPEVTTRANLVYGGHGGFFLSRLSQSQQSTMYQQYEVTDDTVKDYVPVVEEEEDEEDPKKKPITKEADSGRGPGAQKEQHSIFGIFGRRKNDGKPKPIRAKMGEPMKLVYDEEMKAWIDPSIPKDQQVKKAAPPPPPKMKAAQPAMGPKGVPGPPGPLGLSGGPAQAAPPNHGSAANAQSTDQGNIQGGVQGNAPGDSLPAGLGLGGSGGTGPSRTSAPSAPSAPAASATSSALSAPSNPAKSKPQLASANLDDLLSLSSQPGAGGRKAKRGARRGYVNVLDQN